METLSVDLPSWEMQEILAQRKIPLNYYSEDLETDIKTLKKVLK